jgi:hypothetical protein
VAGAVVTRSVAEVEGQRQAAREAAGQSAYRAELAHAWLAALDWVAGDTPTAPITDTAVEPTSENVALEQTRALDREAADRRRGAQTSRAGMVAHALSWYRGEPGTEAPF